MGCQVIGIRKSEFVANTHFLCADGFLFQNTTLAFIFQKLEVDFNISHRDNAWILLNHYSLLLKIEFLPLTLIFQSQCI